MLITKDSKYYYAILVFENIGVGNYEKMAQEQQKIGKTNL